MSDDDLFSERRLSREQEEILHRQQFEKLDAFRDRCRQSQLDRIEEKLDRLLDALEDVDQVTETKLVRADDDGGDEGLFARLFG